MIYGLLAILVVTPLSAFAIRELTFLPDALRFGMILFNVVPTTLNVGVALTASAGGHVVLALFFVIISNLIGIFTVPVLLSPLVSVSSIKLDPIHMILELLLTIVVPLGCGQLLKRLPVVAAFAKKHKARLSISNLCCVALIPFMKISQSAHAFGSISPLTFAILILLTIFIHFAYLAMNFAATALFKFSPATAKAVIICCSQKTLPVAMSILATLPPDMLGEPGLVALPSIAGQLCQTLIDSVLVGHWAAMAMNVQSDPGPKDNTEVKSTAKAEEPATAIATASDSAANEAQADYDSRPPVLLGSKYRRDQDPSKDYYLAVSGPSKPCRNGLDP
jgi:sodium/bile acid cotransporter 7